MSQYEWMYRFGIRPWERYATAAAPSITAMLEREDAGRSHRLGRALDLGCGRGLYTRDLARRGWQAVGVDYVPAAIEAAQAQTQEGATYLVGDVTDLPSGLGTFDFFLDIGCFQGLTRDQQRAQGRGVTRLADEHDVAAVVPAQPSVGIGPRQLSPCEGSARERRVPGLLQEGPDRGAGPPCGP